MAINLPTFFQGDPRWGSKRLGTSNATMANAGCFVTSITMALWNFYINKNPGEVCDRLNEVNAFDKDGFLQHDKINVAFPNVTFSQRYQTTLDRPSNFYRLHTEVAISKVVKLLSYGQPVILIVDLVGNDNLYDHAVVAYEAVDNGNDFKIHDPAFGEDCLFSKRYGKPTEGLYGLVVFIGSPIAFPDNGGDPMVGQCLWKIVMASRGVNTALNLKEAIDVLT